MCGDEQVLVDEVVTSIQEKIVVDEVNFSRLDASDLTHREVWEELMQTPLGKGYKLTIVRHADALLEDETFSRFVASRGKLPRNYSIFVGDSASLPRRESTQGKGELVPALYALKGRGSIVECRAFTASSAKYAVEWVKDKGDIRGSVAEYLLNRATGDLRLVRDTLNKINLFPGEITTGIVNEILEDRPDDTFLDSIFALDKKNALKALKELPLDQYSRTLGLLDARLELAGLVHDMLVERKPTSEIARAAGNKSFLLPDILPVAKYYDKKRRLRIRSVLGTIDNHSSEYGLPDGALIALVALW